MYRFVQIGRRGDPEIDEFILPYLIHLDENNGKLGFDTTRYLNEFSGNVVEKFMPLYKFPGAERIVGDIIASHALDVPISRAGGIIGIPYALKFHKQKYDEAQEAAKEAAKIKAQEYRAKAEAHRASETKKRIMSAVVERLSMAYHIHSSTLKSAIAKVGASVVDIDAEISRCMAEAAAAEKAWKVEQEMRLKTARTKAEVTRRIALEDPSFAIESTKASEEATIEAEVSRFLLEAKDIKEALSRANTERQKLMWQY